MKESIKNLQTLSLSDVNNYVSKMCFYDDAFPSDASLFEAFRFYVFPFYCNPLHQSEANFVLLGLTLNRPGNFFMRFTFAALRTFHFTCVVSTDNTHSLLPPLFLSLYSPFA